MCVCVEIWREAGIWRNGECGEGICTNQNGNDRLRESYRESKYTHCQRLLWTKNLWTGGHHGNGKAQRLFAETRLIMERKR